MSNARPRPILAITHAPVIDHFAAKQLDKPIGNLPAAIETFIYDQTRFLELRAELPHQLGLSMAAGIRHIDVADFTTAGAIDALAIFFNPCGP